MTGSKVLRILKKHGLAPEIPEDLYHLIKKAVSMRKHLEQNRKDRDGKFRLILVESRIHRLARYYKVGTGGLQTLYASSRHALKAGILVDTLDLLRAALCLAARKEATSHMALWRVPQHQLLCLR